MLNEALLVMDVQNGVVQQFAEQSQSQSLLRVLAKAVKAARGSGVPIIFVRVALRPGAPEVSSRNLIFSALAGTTALSDADVATQVHSDVEPQNGEITVTKRRVSAFSGSDLDVVLRSLDVESLVLTGIATSGVVLSTVRQAADLDFRLTVLRDGCVDGSAEVHRVLMDEIFPRQATVVTADEWIAGIASDTTESS